jgi:hypothetical protein
MALWTTDFPADEVIPHPSIKVVEIPPEAQAHIDALVQKWKEEHEKGQ